MSRLRGQGRLLVLVVVGAVAVYVMYNYMGKSNVTSKHMSKDVKVQKYHQLAGRFDIRNSIQRNNPHDISEQEQRGNIPDEHHDSLRRPIFKVDSEEDLRRDGNIVESTQESDPRLEEADNLGVEGDMEQTDTEQGEGQGQGRKVKFSAFVSPTEPDTFDLYSDPNMKFANFFEGLQRLVHLDLKGAPPKMSYLEKMIPLFREMGATGLLIEYEDMFPYSGNLLTISAKNAYTADDVKRINSLASENELQVIPLVQTFGHMEFVLKGKAYQNLREFEDNPQIIMPAVQGESPPSLIVIEAMIKQMHALHPDVKYFHIGCDEVYQLGEGKSKHLLEENHMTKEEMFFSHVRKVAKIVRKLGPQPIVWDDKFRWLNESYLKSSGLGELVQPMVWQYEPQPQRRLPEDIWSKYGKVFSGIWVGSSFKGATGSAQYITDGRYHLENHLNWIEIMKHYGGDENKKYVNFLGVALTGWQRYDHFATLCELLPQAVPSLATCLQTLKNGYFNEDLHADVSRKLLKCEANVELRLRSGENDKSYCKFPGNEFYYAVKNLYGLRKDRLETYTVTHRVSGWMSSYNVIHNFSSPGQNRVFLKNIREIRESFIELRGEFEKILSEIFDRYTVDEFLLVQIDSEVSKIDGWIKMCESLNKRRVWPQRPLIGAEQDDSGETLILVGRKEDPKKKPDVPSTGAPANPNQRSNGFPKLAAGQPNAGQPVGQPQNAAQAPVQGLKQVPGDGKGGVWNNPQTQLKFAGIPGNQGNLPQSGQRGNILNPLNPVRDFNQEINPLGLSANGINQVGKVVEGQADGKGVQLQNPAQFQQGMNPLGQASGKGVQLQNPAQFQQGMKPVGQAKPNPDQFPQGIIPVGQTGGKGIPLQKADQIDQPQNIEEGDGQKIADDIVKGPVQPNNEGQFAQPGEEAAGKAGEPNGQGEEGKGNPPEGNKPGEPGPNDVNADQKLKEKEDKFINEEIQRRMKRRGEVKNY